MFKCFTQYITSMQYIGVYMYYKLFLFTVRNKGCILTQWNVLRDWVTYFNDLDTHTLTCLEKYIIFNSLRKKEY